MSKRIAEKARQALESGEATAASPGPDWNARVRARLLAHYDAARRPLPWRGVADPYRVWVSEIMLQQTRVATVVPYYERWMRRFPTLADLAGAALDDVLRAWEGLGYYARARSLHRAARLVRERYDGALPRDPDALRDLPGVGEYTAGAVASIAFGARVPALDGNARRVLCRLLDRDASDVELRGVAHRLVPAERPGDFNQALMELGATVCTPRSPRCDECPVASLCAARAAGSQELRPGRKPRTPIPLETVATAVLIDAAGRVLLARRPEDGLLGGLWEFPGERVRDGERPARAARRAIARRLGRPRAPGPNAGEVGQDRRADRGREIGDVAHTFSHLRVRYRVFAFEEGGATGGGPPSPIRPDVVWAMPVELDRYALPAAQRKIARLALASAPSVGARRG